MSTLRQYPVAAALLVLGVACSKDRLGPPPPPPSLVVTQAVVSLTTPYSDDGALAISVKGPDLSTFEPSSPSYSLYSRNLTAQEARLIVIGDITDGPLFTIKFSVAHELSAYTVSVEQVAMRSDTLRAYLSGYDTGLTGSSP